MNQSNKAGLDIVPSVGWNNIRLGQTIDEVRSAMTKLGFSFRVMDHDPFMWFADEPGVTCQFLAGAPPRLANISLLDGPMIVNGRDILGLRIDEALLALGIKSFSDTMWSIMDAEDEFENGIPMNDSEQPTDHGAMDLLRYGTLWIHSMGLGLGMNNAHVGQIAIREPHLTPKMGCGALTEDILLTAADPKFKETVDALNAEVRRKLESNKKIANQWGVRMLLTAIALAMIFVPAYLMYNNYSRWSTAAEVTGKIVSMTPETSPDVVTVEYSDANDQLHKVELLASYVPERAVGAEVALLYAADDPTEAIPLSERFDQVFEGYSPYLLVISPTIAIFLIAWAYPELSRKR